MPGETSLNQLLTTLECNIHPTVWVWVTMSYDRIKTPFQLSPDEIQLWFREAEGLTIVIPLERAEERQMEYTYRCRMITLNVHSSLEAVGFMAVIARRLADAGLSSNPVSAYFHDHIFVEEEKAEKALKILEAIRDEAATRGALRTGET